MFYRCSFVTGAQSLQALDGYYSSRVTGAHLLQEPVVTGAHTVLIGNAKGASNYLSTSKWCFAAFTQHCT